MKINDYINKIYCGDCNKILPTFKDDSVDLIVTSPPYNLNKNYGSSDNLMYEDYLSFLEETWKNCYKVLKYDGRICINHGNISLGQRRFTLAHISNQLENIGFKFRDFIIWNKQNIHKRTAWGSWLSPSSPYLIQPFEYILIYNKHLSKKKGRETDLMKEEFIEWTNALWSFKPETKIKNHPAPFPEELPKRLIKLYSYVDDIVLDPFMGSGTTCLASKQFKRNFIGIELNKEYCEIASRRIGNVPIVEFKKKDKVSKVEEPKVDWKKVFDV